MIKPLRYFIAASMILAPPITVALLLLAVGDEAILNKDGGGFGEIMTHLITAIGYALMGCTVAVFAWYEGLRVLAVAGAVFWTLVALPIAWVTSAFAGWSLHP